MSKSKVWGPFLAGIIAGVSLMSMFTACGKIQVEDTEAFDASIADSETSAESIAVEEEASSGGTVVFQNDAMTISIEDEGRDEDIYYWDMSVENKTETECIVSFSEVAVNGVACDPYWSETVPAGEVISSKAAWDIAELTHAGIVEISTVQLTVGAWDLATLSDLLEDTIVTVILKNDAETQNTTFNPIAAFMVADTDEYAVYITDTGVGDYNELGIDAVIINKLQEPVTLSIKSATIAEKECDPHWAETIPADAMAYSRIVFASSTLDAIGMEAGSVDEVDLVFSYVVGSHWMETPTGTFSYTLDVSDINQTDDGVAGIGTLSDVLMDHRSAPQGTFDFLTGEFVPEETATPIWG